MQELDMLTSPTASALEPLRWSLHGGPGTGKPHVLKMFKNELFEHFLKWNMGVEFQIAALQAVMADLLEGDTIHHALGIQAVGRQLDCLADDTRKQLDVAKQILQWRLFLIDEISMVSAKLLADIDMKMRALVRSVSPHQRNGHQQFRSVAGLNVILSGDFWQLPHRKEVSSETCLRNTFTMQGSTRPHRI